MNEAIVVVVFILSCGSAVVLTIFLGFFAFLRYMRYKEVMTLAEKGLVHPSQTTNGSSTLRWGIGITALGMALCLGLYPIGWAVNDGFPLRFGPWMLIGLIPTFFGLALVAIYYLAKRKPETDTTDTLEEKYSEKVVVEDDLAMFSESGAPEAEDTGS